MADDHPSQTLEAKKLELVESLSRLVAPMDAILADHKASQVRAQLIIDRLDEVSSRLHVVSRLMIIGCCIGLLLVGAVAYSLVVQNSLRDLQRRVLFETLKQKEAITKQGQSTEDVKRALDEQPKIRVRQAPSSDPSGAPVMVIETPTDATSASKKAARPKPPRPSSRVEIPIQLPQPSADPKQQSPRR